MTAPGSALPKGQEPTEQLLQQVEQEEMRKAVKPFHNPKPQNMILGAREPFQVIDESTKDTALRAPFDGLSFGERKSHADQLPAAYR